MPRKPLKSAASQADIERISYAKVVLDIDNATETVVKNLSFALYDYNDQLVEDEDIHAMSDFIQVTMPIQVIKELPLNVSFEESPGSSLSNVNYSITPESITVSGNPSILESVDSLLLGSISLAELDNSAHVPLHHHAAGRLRKSQRGFHRHGGGFL